MYARTKDASIQNRSLRNIQIAFANSSGVSTPSLAASIPFATIDGMACIKLIAGQIDLADIGISQCATKFVFASAFQAHLSPLYLV